MRIAALVLLLLVACSPSEDERLVEMLNRDIPALQQADDFTKLELLTDWTAQVVDVRLDVPDNTQRIVEISAGETYRDIWLPDDGGARCAGFAVFFQKLVGLFGYEAYTVDMGWDGTPYTHVTVLVDVGGKLYLFDPTFNGHHVSRETGLPLPIGEALSRPADAAFKSRPVRRAFIQAGNAPGCAARGEHFACMRDDGVLQTFVTGLADLGHPGEDIFLALMSHRVYSVSGPDPERVAEIIGTGR